MSPESLPFTVDGRIALVCLWAKGKANETLHVVLGPSTEEDENEIGNESH